jgi:hypothetical protein
MRMRLKKNRMKIKTMSHLKRRTLIKGEMTMKTNKRLGIKDLLSHPGFRGPKPEREINTRCARTKSHTYDEKWYRNECHIFTI